MIREFDNDRWNGYPYMTNERVREKCLEICRSSSERKSMESKPRILYLQKILLERTDEENMLSTTQLINILNDEYGISAHRTTITKDIAALQEFGMDIVVIHSTQSKYFVASRKFELPELKLLIDAVESSKFITSKTSIICFIRQQSKFISCRISSCATPNFFVILYSLPSLLVLTEWYIPILFCGINRSKVHSENSSERLFFYTEKGRSRTGIS